MTTIDDQTIDKVILALSDVNNPATAFGAAKLISKWLKEHELTYLSLTDGQIKRLRDAEESI
ncbi:hypothetical protein [Pectobacterium carotovorum]|uniref:hypothetical protein n=1 Tax=Pectobacterium carotovorum TaxID=554 RepID=UPI0020835B58|nr:hypothetical protein [Pectobacterium carotovorum]GKV88467.1 hypothetical protein PEC301619_04490 [Pectobacterium carotovorum subsp. carotovorum]